MFQAMVGSIRLLSKREKAIVLALALSTIGLNAVDIVALALVGLVGGVVVGEALPAWFVGPIAVLGNTEMTVILLLVIASLFVVKTVSGIFLARGTALFLAGLESRFSAIIADDVFLGGLAKVKAHSRADLEWSILRSTQISFGQILGLSLRLCAEASLALAVLVLFFLVDWRSAVVVLVYFSLVILLFQLASRRQLEGGGELFKSGSVSVGQGITDVVSTYKEAFVLSRIAPFIRRIVSARRQVAISSARNAYFQSIPRLIVELGLITGAIGFLMFQIFISDGDPSLTVIGIFIMGSLRMMSALLPMQRAFMQLRFDAPQAASAQRMIQASIPRAEGSGAPPATLPGLNPAAALKVEVKSVCFAYADSQSGHQAISDVNLTVAGGQTVALIGPSGAGKTTLVDLILGLQTPIAGEILWGEYSPAEVRAHYPGLVAYVPQKPGLIAGTIQENIALGIETSEVDQTLLWRVIDSADLRDFVNTFPQGVEAYLGSNADSLSGGQIQRIGLARALYGEPRLLVLDEATSALDADTESTISKSLVATGGERTTIVVAHRLSTVQRADVICVVDQGRIVASGTLGELKEKVPLVRRYIKLMAVE